jgi:hypothetical protein
MPHQKNNFVTLLIVAAALSVIAFSGIGVAAITGNLSITHSGLNPFSSFSTTPAGAIIPAAPVTTERHKGLTRNRGETPAEGKPVNFQFGARVPTRKSVCPDCGVVDSIVPGNAIAPATDIGHSQVSGSEGATILQVAGKAEVDEQNESRTTGFIVTIHMENGTVRIIYETERPLLNIGERIKLVNGSLISLG